MLIDAAGSWLKTGLEVGGVVLGLPAALLALRKLVRRSGEAPTQPPAQHQEVGGTGNVAIQARDGAQVNVFHQSPTPAGGPPDPPARTPVLTPVEIRLLSTAKAHSGLLPLLRESFSGRGAYVGPFGHEALECDRELEHLVDLGLLRPEPSMTQTIKFRLTSAGWERLDLVEKLQAPPSMSEELIEERHREAEKE
jgi:hypothetical protein